MSQNTDYATYVLELISETSKQNGFKVIKENKNRLTLENDKQKIKLFIYYSNGIKGNPNNIWMGVKDGTVDFLKEAKDLNDRFLVVVNKKTKNFLVLPYQIEQQFMKFKNQKGWDNTGKLGHSFDIEIFDNKARFQTRDGTYDEKYYDCNEYLNNTEILFSYRG